jgi:hypothetical protein
LKDNKSGPRKIVVERILSAIAGAIAGAVTGLISGLFLATIAGGDNDLMFGFLAIYSAPGGLVIGLVVGAVVGILLYRYAAYTENRRVGFALFVVGLPAVVLGMLWIVNSRDVPPSDRSLLANFDRHEKTFNQLIEMVKADRDLTRVDTDWTDPREPETIGVTAHRITTYRRMLADARVPRGFQTQGLLIEVDFFYWMIGSAISSDKTKGYAYIEGPAFNVVESLDGYKPKPHGDNVIKVYRHIRGNWYLFYEYIPG